VIKSLTGFIEKKLKLRVNKGKSAAGKASKRSLLGFIIRLNKGGCKICISGKSLARVKERIRQITARTRGSA
jgi:RNA-directed DNA polymerase